MKFATRINSFLRTGKTVLEAIGEIGGVDGVDYVDLNYPEHFSNHSVNEIKQCMNDNNIKCNAINLRFRQFYLNGEFGNNDIEISNEALKLCKEAADMCKKLGGKQIIIWLGFDGFDYSFQIDYNKVWNQVVHYFKEVCDYTDLEVSIEYKPYEERVHCLIDSFGTTMLMLHDVEKENLGVTLDFCHMLMKRENPAFAATWLLKRGKLFNMHLNDGEGVTDDGLMVGTVNLLKTIEVFYYLIKYDFQGVVYFDTFPKREGAVEECKANIAMSNRIIGMIEKCGMYTIEQVIKSNDATQVSNMLTEMLK